MNVLRGCLLTLLVPLAAAQFLPTHLVDQYVDFIKEFQYKFTEIPVGRADTNNVTCLEQLNLYQTTVGGLLSGSLTPDSMWALTMFDASTKIPEGLLSGNIVHMGNFDECVRLQNVQSSAGVFDGQHCMPSILVDTGPKPGRSNSSGLSNIWERRKQELRAAFGMNYGVVPLQISVCVPSTCGVSEVRDFTAGLVPAILGDVEVVLDEINCETNKPRTLSGAAAFAVVVFVIFGVLVICSTGLDLWKNKPERLNRPLFLAFSLPLNWGRLIDTRSSGETLSSMPGIRFLSIAWVVLGHQNTVASQRYSMNLLQFNADMLKDWYRLYLTNGTLSVDTFFVMSGLLVCYVFMRTVNKTNKFNLLKFYVHRYIRLTPVLAVIVLYSATLEQYISFGPVWRQSIEPIRDFCVKHWWSDLLYINNYVNPRDICHAETWFLAIDMQLYWLSPLVLVPLWKSPPIGVALSVAFCLASEISTFVISWAYDIRPSMALTNSNDKVFEFQELYYYATQCRIPVYIVGIWAGYALYKMKTTGFKLKLSKWQSAGAWLAVAACLLVPLLVMQAFYEPTYKFEPVGVSLFNALHRTVWAAGIAGLILLCTTGYGGPVNTFLSWKFFLPLSRLSYGIYLTHLSVMNTQTYSLRTAQYIGDVTVFPVYFGNLVISALISILLCLVFEFPFMVLEKELLGDKPQSRPADVKANHEGENEHEKRKSESSVESLEVVVEQQDGGDDTSVEPSTEDGDGDDG